MDAWFPKIRADGTIVSGSNGIWITRPDGSVYQWSPTGGRPAWANTTVVYQNGLTTAVGNCAYASGFNEIVGNDDGQWAGTVQDAVGSVRHFVGPDLAAIISAATIPRFLGWQLGYITPYQGQQRTLVIGGKTIPLKLKGVSYPTLPLTTWSADRGGVYYTYTVGVSTYGRRIIDHLGNDCTIRTQEDETPYHTFTGPDGHPHILSWTPDYGAFERMIYAEDGYQIKGLLNEPDCRMFGGKLRIVGSKEGGQPREVWIDYTQPKINLRTL